MPIVTRAHAPRHNQRTQVRRVSKTPGAAVQAGVKADLLETRIGVLTVRAARGV